jgi:two-component system, NarL family, nitrate/nitrite response regulator NarL
MVSRLKSKRAIKHDSPVLGIMGQTRLYCECLALALASRHEFTIIHMGAEDIRATQGAKRVEPDIVLLDLPEKQASTILRELRLRLPSALMIGLNVDNDDDLILRLLGAGLDGFVLKESPLATLRAAIESGIRGDVSCPAGILTRLAQKIETRRGRFGLPPALSSREREVIHLVEQGLTNKEIATRLGLEAATVKNHVHHIMDKLSVHSRMDAVAQLRAAASEAKRQKV